MSRNRPSKKAPKKQSTGGKVKLNNGKLRSVKKRYEQFKFDSLQMYMDYPYVIKSKVGEGCIVINSPTLGNIIELGQDRFYMAINPFITNTTQFRLQLWNAGTDWNEMSDFELFITFILSGHMDNEALSLVFGNSIDWNAFVPDVRETDDGKKIYYLVNEGSDLVIDEDMYQHMTQYLHYLINVFPEEKITSDRGLKIMYIRTDEKKKKNHEDDVDKESFSLQPLISSCVNHPGFKYKKSELKELSLYEFYDSVQRLQIYESTTALLKGSYSGFMDSSKIPSESFNWMRAVN